MSVAATWSHMRAPALPPGDLDQSEFGPEVDRAFFRGMLFALPIALSLWAGILIGAARLI